MLHVKVFMIHRQITIDSISEYLNIDDMKYNTNNCFAIISIFKCHTNKNVDIKFNYRFVFRQENKVRDCVLLKNKRTYVNLYHGGNKLHSDQMMMMSYLH